MIEQMHNALTRLNSFIERWKLVTPGSVGAAVLGFAGFMLSPIKPMLFGYLWPPHPMIVNDLVSMRKPVLRGDRFVIRLHLVAEPGKKLPLGTVQVVADGGGVEVSDPSVFDIDGNDSSKDVEFQFTAHKAGLAAMRYEYISGQKKVAVQPVTLEISDSPAGCLPRVDDISGCWEAQWGKSFGEIKLELKAHGQLGGDFRLLNTDTGQNLAGTIGGYANGSNVLITLNEAGKKRHR